MRAGTAGTHDFPGQGQFSCGHTGELLPTALWLEFDEFDINTLAGLHCGVVDCDWKVFGL